MSARTGGRLEWGLGFGVRPVQVLVTGGNRRPSRTVGLAACASSSGLSKNLACGRGGGWRPLHRRTDTLPTRPSDIDHQRGVVFEGAGLEGGRRPDTRAAITVLITFRGARMHSSSGTGAASVLQRQRWRDGPPCTCAPTCWGMGRPAPSWGKIAYTRDTSCANSIPSATCKVSRESAFATTFWGLLTLLALSENQ